jgi:hypothetical protein
MLVDSRSTDTLLPSPWNLNLTPGALAANYKQQDLTPYLGK